MLRNHKGYLFVVLIFLVASLSACGALQGSNTDGLRASGVVEADEVNIAPEISGRVAQVNVREGSQVQKGEKLFILEGDLVAAQLEQANSVLDAAQAQLSIAEAGLLSAEKSLEIAQVNNEIAQLQYELQHAAILAEPNSIRAQSWSHLPPAQIEEPNWYFSQDQEIQALKRSVETAEERFSEAQAELDELIDTLGGNELRQLEQDLNLAQVDFQVAQELFFRPIEADVEDFLRDTIRDQYEDARASLDDAQDALDRQLNGAEQDELSAARAEVSVLQEAYSLSLLHYYQALSGENSLSLKIASKQRDQAALSVEQAEAGRAQAAAHVDQARKAVAQAEANLAIAALQQERLTVSAPVSGTILASSVDEGEVVQAGGTLMTIGILDEMQITVYLPENQYGRVNVGDRASVEVDSFPGEIFSAQVIHIADQAEFTPRNVQTEEERQTTVYAVELSVISGEGQLKPGMPADVIFDTLVASE